MAEARDTRLRRLRWRSRRGMKELDRVLIQWLDRHGPTAPDDELLRYERLLAVEDAALWPWVLGRVPADPEFAPLVDQLRAEYRP